MDPAVLETRMQVYEKETSLLLNHYPKEIITHFNADQKPLEVLRDVLVGMSDVLVKNYTTANKKKP